MIHQLEKGFHDYPAIPVAVQNCPFCGSGNLTFAKTGKSRTGVMQTVVQCNACQGSAAFNWLESRPHQRVFVKESPPTKAHLQTALENRNRTQSSTVQGN